MSKKACIIEVVGNFSTGRAVPLEVFRSAEQRALVRAGGNFDDNSVMCEFINIGDENGKGLLADGCDKLKMLRRYLFGEVYASTAACLIRTLPEKVGKAVIRKAHEKASGGEPMPDEAIESIYEDMTKQACRPRAGILWIADREDPPEFVEYLAAKFGSDLAEAVQKNAQITVFESNPVKEYRGDELFSGNVGMEREERRKHA